MNKRALVENPTWLMALANMEPPAKKMSPTHRVLAQCLDIRMPPEPHILDTLLAWRSPCLVCNQIMQPIVSLNGERKTYCLSITCQSSACLAWLDDNDFQRFLYGLLTETINPNQRVPF